MCKVDFVANVGKQLKEGFVLAHSLKKPHRDGEGMTAGVGSIVSPARKQRAMDAGAKLTVYSIRDSRAWNGAVHIVGLAP